MASGIQQYTKLESRLVLISWLNEQLGYKSNRDLLEDTRDVGEGFHADGHSYLYHHLIARGGQVLIPETDLARYDRNIRAHLDSINRHRHNRIMFRYFQQLAAFFAEIFLDRVSIHIRRLTADLNAFVDERNMAKLPGEPQDVPFSTGDFTKLAYWMATGSGKTLIMHLNYRQFLHYNTEPLDSILLITPNEGLSDQHLAELAASGIPARRFDLNSNSLWAGRENAVQVLEITKLVEQKRGGGVSVPVEAFEGRNLIFVDEGHKGSGGKVWRRYRDALGETGFTFEYSATFGQALTAARNDPLTADYGKSIIFDYSYRYFYGDGFGKDFRILNLKDEDRPEHTETLLMGSVLSFYEQLRTFSDMTDVLRPYDLEKPLWVFVGSTVNAVYTRQGQKRSDVLTLARFLHHVLQDRRWSVATIKKILAGKSGLQSPDGQDVFLAQFPFIRELGLSPSGIYTDLLARIFHAPGGGALHLADIRGHAGEIGLKAANTNTYFGLIYIGDTSAFKKLVEEDQSGIILEDDALSGSLFDPINSSDSPIHVLVGAKKFMEGWNSWRVSNMGLLNIGRQEGSQIIQLFGRGVRLRGKGFSLKRSAALPGEHPKHLGLLETLNIFAVRANYMAQFRDYLEREGMETEPAIELPLFTWINKPALNKKLIVPRLPQGKAFANSTQLVLEPDEKIHVRVDLSVKVHAMESSAAGLQTSKMQTGQPRGIPDDSLVLVDWEQAYLDMMEYKSHKGYDNLIIQPETAREIVANGPHTLIAEEVVVRPQAFAHRALLQEAVNAILRKYIEIYYRRSREKWEMSAMEYQALDDADPNLDFKPESVSEAKAAYLVKVPRSEEQLLRDIQELLDETERLYNEESRELPRINFDRHLYLPLLVEQIDKLKITPPALKPSEAQFVRDLKEYWEIEKGASLSGKDVFLLRNLSRGYGIGFFEERSFYPDFVLWILDGQRQRVIFLEPHGMVHAKAYEHDEKARLHERLPALAMEIAARSTRKQILLDSFIISATEFQDLYKRYDDGTWDRGKFAVKHILFPERGPEYDYMKLIFAGNKPVVNGG